MTSNTLETLRRCIQALEACSHRLAEDVANSEALGTLAEPGTTSRAAADAIETRRELVALCQMTITEAANHHQELQAMNNLTQQLEDARTEAVALRATEQNLTEQLAAWKTALTPLMPGDFKDWHGNHDGELPQVAAFVVANLRARIAELEAARVPEIDYLQLIAAAEKRHRRWTPGTTGCVAFSSGAEWFRGVVLASAAQPEKGPQ